MKTKKATQEAEKGYNGWTNYETWLVALWMDNDQGSAIYWREEAKGHIMEDGPNKLTGNPTATYNLSRQMKDEIEEGIPEGVEGFYADLLNAALSEVNWMEIAKHYTDEVL